MDDGPRETMDIAENSFTSSSDICQQLMDRYAKSAASQHRHLLATAAAMRSILTAESLPLTSTSYFAAAINSVDSSSASKALDSTAVGALLAFLAIVLPLIPSQGIAASKATEAVEVLVRLLKRESDGLATASVRALMKCMGHLLIEFCDNEDWSSFKLGFETVLRFSVDKRPKVRRCAQDCLEKVFKSFRGSTVKNEASKLVLSLLESYMPLAVNLSTSRISDESKVELLSRPDYLELLHMLNVLHLIFPCLSIKDRQKIFSNLHKLMKSQFSSITRHVFKIIEVFFETSSDELLVQDIENIINSLVSYVSIREKNPMDTVITGATLLQSAVNKLHAGESISWISYLPIVCDPLAGLLTCEDSIASKASNIMKELIRHHIDKKLVNEYQPSEDEGLESIEANAIRSTCLIFENLLKTCDGIPNEHISAVISVLFLQLGDLSFIFLKSIVLKLADMITVARVDMSKTDHLQNCLGSVVAAMGPERLLALLPISLQDNDFSCSNIWLVPVLKNHVVGAPLGYYMNHIVPLAKSFQCASRKVKKSVIGQDLQAHAHGLWGLLPAFCRYAIDTKENFRRLSKLLIAFLRKDSFMHENIAVALQVIVNQNKGALGSKTETTETDCSVEDLVSEVRDTTSFTKKTARRNIKALASRSPELLDALINLFVESLPGKRAYLKDAIGSLVSISDSSISKNIFMSMLERFHVLDGGSDSQEMGNQTDELPDEEQGNLDTTEKVTRRAVLLELASSLLEGAEEDLIDLIYNLIIQTFKGTNEIGLHEAYHTLSRILEEHSSFCSDRHSELIDLLIGLKSPVDIETIRSRFSCFHILMVHTLQMSLDEENTKAFLILNEIILTLKDAKEEVRKAAYDILLVTSSSLRNSSDVSSDASYQKLIHMIMGYLSGSSPQIKSGAVSALSVLVYNDTNICITVPDLLPSLLSLLQSKIVEVIKAVLGFMKVLVSSLQANDLQNILSDVINGILPWSSVSRNHFRLKVIVILEIMLRKCGSAAVKSVVPERHKNFLKTVLENRRSNKSSSGADAAIDVELEHADSSTTGLQRDRDKALSNKHEKNGAVPKRKRKWEDKQDASTPKIDKSHFSSGTGGELRSRKRDRDSIPEKSVRDQSEGNREGRMGNFKRGRTSGGKRNMGKTSMGDAATHRRNAPKSRKPMKFVKKRHSTKSLS